MVKFSEYSKLIKIVARQFGSLTLFLLFFLLFIFIIINWQVLCISSWLSLNQSRFSYLFIIFFFIFISKVFIDFLISFPTIIVFLRLIHFFDYINFIVATTFILLAICCFTWLFEEVVTCDAENDHANSSDGNLVDVDFRLLFFFSHYFYF